MLPQILLLLFVTSPLILGKPYKTSTRTHARSDDSGCRRMRRSGGIGKRGILCIGQLRADRLIVITRDYQVYQLPMNSLTTSVSKLYINDTKPVPLSVKWPRIASSRRFKAVLPLLYNAFFYVNSEHEFLYLTTKWSRSHQFGATFDVDTQQGWQGLTYYDADDQVLIGSFNRQIFYAINKMGGQLRLLRYLRHCRPGEPPASCNITQTGEPVYDLCKKEGANQMVIQLVDSKNPCPRLNWPVLNGFISSDTFYLFGSSYVVTFPETIWGRPNEPVTYNSTSYGDFIQCGGSNRERSAQVTRSKYGFTGFHLLTPNFLFFLFQRLPTVWASSSPAPFSVFFSFSVFSSVWYALLSGPMHRLRRNPRKALLVA